MNGKSIKTVGVVIAFLGFAIETTSLWASMVWYDLAAFHFTFFSLMIICFVVGLIVYLFGAVLVQLETTNSLLQSMVDKEDDTKTDSETTSTKSN